jgi:hypothetical protein
VRIKSERDFWAGMMFIAVGVIFAIGATNYSMGPACPPNDPAPRACGAAVAALGAPRSGLLSPRPVDHPRGPRRLRPLQVADDRDEGGDKVGSFAWKPLVIIVIAIGVFGAMLEPIGS